MKKRISFCVFITIILCIVTSACSKQSADLWSEATYTTDTELGSGKNTVLVEVVAEDKSVTFTVHSDKTILGDVLLEHSLIEGEKGAYGLYVKKVNGITADYDINQSYWGLFKNGESLMTGVDGTEFKDGEHYEIVYTK